MIEAIDFTEVVRCDLVAAHAQDLAVVNAARISFDQQHGELRPSDEGLIHFLMRERHGSPFEHVFFKFRVEAPIFAFREHHRHRVGHSYNEMSGRYTELGPKFYVPRCARIQQGKPGAYFFVEQPEDSEASRFLRARLHGAYTTAWASYKGLLAEGIAKEQARMVLPLGIYTRMIWSCNARSLMHFLGLRNSPQAQKEIRLVAEEAEEALKHHMPITYEAFVKNARVAP